MTGNGTRHTLSLEERITHLEDLRAEYDQLPSRVLTIQRDIGALIANDRAHDERFRELSSLASQGLAAVETLIGRLDTMDDALGAIARALVGKKRRAKK